MTAPKTAKRSAYPKTIPALVDAARKITPKVGPLPSQGEVMRTLHIGQPKAREVLSELARTRLHAVPAPAVGSLPEPPPEWPPIPSENVDVPAPKAAPKPTSGPAPERVESAPPAPPAAPPRPAPAQPAEPAPEPKPVTAASSGPQQVTPVPEPEPERPGRPWAVLFIALPAMVAIWSGWVGLGGMAGFGVIHPLPGIVDRVTLNTAITLPIGVEVYAAYALRVWLSSRVPERARRFARRSAIASLATGALGQIAYHLLAAAHMDHAPWWITTLVACLPVAVLGMAASLAHLIRTK